jgi:predicted PhzF superfamily epimerase YddE/YHI9
MTVATGTSSGVLTAWLRNRLQGQDRVTAIVDGEEVGAVPPGERS